MQHDRVGRLRQLDLDRRLPLKRIGAEVRSEPERVMLGDGGPGETLRRRLARSGQKEGDENNTPGGLHVYTLAECLWDGINLAVGTVEILTWAITGHKPVSKRTVVFRNPTPSAVAAGCIEEMT